MKKARSVWLSAFGAKLNLRLIKLQHNQFKEDRAVSQSDSLPSLPSSLPPSLPALLPPLARRPLNRPPGWTTRTADGRGWWGGRQQFSFSWSAPPERASERLSLGRFVGPSAAAAASVRLLGPSRRITHYKLTANELS